LLGLFSGTAFDQPEFCGLNFGNLARYLERRHRQRAGFTVKILPHWELGLILSSHAFHE
jgi:hypothetical protein